MLLQCDPLTGVGSDLTIRSMSKGTSLPAGPCKGFCRPILTKNCCAILRPASRRSVMRVPFAGHTGMEGSRLAPCENARAASVTFSQQNPMPEVNCILLAKRLRGGHLAQTTCRPVEFCTEAPKKAPADPDGFTQRRKLSSESPLRRERGRDDKRVRNVTPRSDLLRLRD